MDNKSIPNIAVLLAAYNGKCWIEQQIKSILNQKGVKVSLFVSVDKSDDGTQQLVEEIASENYQVTVLPYGKRFGSAAKNFYRLFKDVGFDSFDAVALADQDDIWFEDKLCRSCTFISGQYDVYSSNVIAFWSDGRTKLIEKAQPQTSFDHFFEAAGPGCTYVFRSNVASELKELIIHKETELISIDLHDWMAYAFCRNMGYKWYIDSVPTMMYRQHAANHVGANVDCAAYRKRLLLLKSKWYRRQVEHLVLLLAPELIDRLGSKLYLAKNIYKVRRRVRDRLFMLSMLIVGWY